MSDFPIPTLSGGDLGGLDDTITQGSVVVVTQTGQKPYAYLVKSQDNQISVLDTSTPTELSCRYTSHAYTGQAQDREQVKRILRVRVYGEGVISPDLQAVPDDRTPLVPSGLMTITADGVRQDTYQYSVMASEPWNGILWLQQTMALKGRRFDIDILLKGTGIIIREVGWEYVLVN